MRWNTYALFLPALLAPVLLHAQKAGTARAMPTQKLDTIHVTDHHLSAQKPDTIRAADHRLRTYSLKAGTHRYLVYNENEQGQRTNVWIWERIVSITHAPKAHITKTTPPDFFVVKQHWFGTDSLQTEREMTSYCRWKDFSPVYQYSQFSNVQRTLTEAYDFRKDSVVTADSVKTDRPRFAQALPAPTFNWELDLELFPLLPLKDGKSLMINLYHPGASAAPAYYAYTVKGQDNLVLYNGRKAHCWVLSIDYGHGNYAIWWIDKKKRVVWRMKEYFDGQYRFKVLMTS